MFEFVGKNEIFFKYWSTFKIQLKVTWLSNIVGIDHHLDLLDQAFGVHFKAFESIEIDLLDNSFKCLSIKSLFSVRMY